MLTKLFLIALFVFFLLDMIWLGLVSKNLYQQQLGYLLAPKVNWIAAVLFYLLFILALCLFVIQPAVEKKSLTTAIYMGAFFGLVTYATYDLTNLATIKNWPVFITIVDLIWGTLLSSSVATVTYLIVTKYIR